MAPRQNLYINQAYTIQLDTDTDLSTASTIQIRYVKPDGTIAYLTATETATGSGIITALMSGATNNAAGEWQLRAWITFSNDPNPVPGTPVQVIIQEIT